MDNDDIVSAIATLQAQMQGLSTNMKDEFERLRKCFDEMKLSYSGSIKEINCKIEDRIKASDTNQGRTDDEIIKLKAWKKEMDEARLQHRVASLEKNWAVIAVISSIVGSIFFTLLGKLM